MLLVHCSWSALTCSHVSPSPFSPSPFHHKHIEVFLTFPLITHAFPPFFLFFFPSKPFHIIQFSLCRVGFSGQFLNFLAMKCSPGGFAQLCRLLGRFGPTWRWKSSCCHFSWAPCLWWGRTFLSFPSWTLLSFGFFLPFISPSAENFFTSFADLFLAQL